MQLLQRSSELHDMLPHVEFEISAELLSAYHLLSSRVEKNDNRIYMPGDALWNAFICQIIAET